MARHSLPLTDDFLKCPPWVWLIALSMALPWLRLDVQGWAFYPGHLAGGLVAGLLLVAREQSGIAWRGIRPLLLIGGYLIVLHILRGEWAASLVILGNLCIHGM